MNRDAEPAAPSLHDRAFDNLRYIRSAMERASAFTAVPGWGGLAMGVTAVFAAVIASGRRSDPVAWLKVWLVEAVVGLSIGMVATVWKARRSRIPLSSGSSRRFAYSFTPPLLVGALLTYGLIRAGAYGLLPAVWLLTYGAAVIAGGAFSVPVVPVLGMAFMLVGGVAVFAGPAWGDVLMGVGFGGLEIVFGVWIARRHGG